LVGNACRAQRSADGRAFGNGAASSADGSSAECRRPDGAGDDPAARRSLPADGPLVFTPEDSGTEACPGDLCGLSGRASGHQRRLAYHRLAAGRAPLADQRPQDRLGQRLAFQPAVHRGQRRTRARTPNRGEFFRTDGPTVSGGNRSFYFHEGDIQPWDRLQDAIVVVYHSWETSIHHIRAVDVESRSILLREPAPWPMGRWERQQRYFVENVFEALDQPGEWYLNQATGTLYYWPMPGETPETLEAVAPIVTSTLLEINGDPASGRYVEHLHFRGIAWLHTNSNLHRLRNPGQGEVYQPGLIHAQGCAMPALSTARSPTPARTGSGWLPGVLTT
jgi:hypothetical protein